MSTGSDGYSRRPAVWLATLSTVVGVATGMFTLRDHVFSSEQGSAEAASLPAYQQSVGGICSALNRAEAERARDNKRLRLRLRRVTLVGDRRDAVLQTVQQALADSDRQLSVFEGLQIPDTHKARHAATATAWNRNADRLRDYAQRLNATEKRRDLFAAITRYADAQPAISRAGVVRDSGLVYLGGAHCNLGEVRFTSPIRLPGLKKDVAPSPAIAERDARPRAAANRGSAGPGGPGRTYPGRTYPGRTNPARTHPGGTNPGRTHPGRTNPGRTNPGRTNPGTTDPGRTDPGTTDPRPDPGTTDPGVTDPGTTDPGTTDAGTTDPGATDAGSSGEMSD